MLSSRAVPVRGRRERPAAASVRPGRGKPPTSKPPAHLLVRLFGENAAFTLSNPGTFAMRALRAFKANQGLLLAGAVAYYTLLSLVPLLVLTVIGLAHVTDQAQLLATVEEYLEFLVPGQSAPLIEQLRLMLAHREVVGGVLLEFPTIPGRDYSIEYGTDLIPSGKALTVITATKDRTQWVDIGPPETEAKPLDVSRRFYRAVLLPQSP